MTLPPQNQLKKLLNNFARFLHVTHIKLVIPTSVNPAWGIILINISVHTDVKPRQIGVFIFHETLKIVVNRYIGALMVHFYHF